MTDKPEPDVGDQCLEEAREFVAKQQAISGTIARAIILLESCGYTVMPTQVYNVLLKEAVRG